MRKILFLLIFIGFIGLIARGILFFTAEKAASQPEVKQSIQKAAENVSKKVQNPGIPKTLKIPKLNVTADIESVGMDEKGNMDVPDGVYNVAWYNLGYKPGGTGSAVIAGHYDTPTGDPSVFYNLSDLQSGDKIEVTDDQGETYNFAVTDSTRYDVNNVPLKEIFDSRDKPRLNLITCDGVFNKASQIYSKRLVVYAEMVQ